MLTVQQHRESVSRVRAALRQHRRVIGVCALALAATLLAAWRVETSASVLSATSDEADHVVAGLEWWTTGRYTYESQHPPLARIAVALGPYRAGARPPARAGDFFWDGDVILRTAAGDSTILLKARHGILPFFLLAVLAAWLWGWRLGGAMTAAWSVLLVSFMPPVLAHASVATTDVPVTATIGIAGYLIARWLDAPGSLGRAAAMAVGVAVAACTKFSAIPFLGAATVAWLLTRLPSWLAQRGEAWLGPFSRRAALVGLVTVAFAAATIASIYRFSTGRILGLPVFAPEFFRGILDVAEHNRAGHLGYLLGHVSLYGTWTYFPVALGVKTPIGILLLGLLGAGALVSRWRRRRDPRAVEIPLAALAILAIGMSASINIGVRHVLPMYLPLAILAAVGLETLWRSRRAALASRSAAVALIGWIATDVSRAGPDYLSYFNEFARRDPGRVLVDSDLDWGQDVGQLRRWLAARQIESFYYRLFTYDRSRRLAKKIFPKAAELRPYQEEQGWIAISESYVREGDVSYDRSPPSRYSKVLKQGQRPIFVQQDAFRWLDRYQPVTRIGRSIRVYRVP